MCLFACGGGSGGGSLEGRECRATAECADGLECAGPNDPQVCGIAPQEDCFDDSTCSGGDRCHAVVDECSPDGIGSACRPACTGTACDSGFTCIDGACLAISCADGFACEPQEICDASRITPETPTFDRHHGCFALTCTTDDQCPADLFCVKGTCHDGPGTCTKPIVVP
jgi:hypothetical protein